MVVPMSPAESNPPSLVCILAFNAGNQLAVRRLGSKAGLAFTGADLAMALGRLEAAFPEHTAPVERFSASAGGRLYRVFLARADANPRDREVEFWTIERLEAAREVLAPALAGLVARL